MLQTPALKPLASTLIQTAKLNTVDPHTWLAWILRRIAGI
ncbi:transposase domain-containing protein [Sulfitobacter sp. SK012]